VATQGSATPLPFEQERPISHPILEVVYEGPSIREGRLSLIVLADALKGMGNLTERTNEILFSQPSRFSIELAAPPSAGSLIIPVDFISRAAETAEVALTNKHVLALATLVTLLGLSPAKDAVNLFKLFKRFRGRRVEDVSELPQINIDIDIHILLKLYNDAEIRSSILKILRPLREPGIDSFQTRRDRYPIETVFKSDLEAADRAEEAELRAEEEVTLEIEKAALRRSLSWHFSYAQGSFDASIHDDEFWKGVDRGERFGSGDRMEVVL
jgi:hypothetical protein